MPHRWVSYWSELPGYQVIVASDCVTALHIPALFQTRSHAGGCAPALVSALSPESKEEYLPHD
jgi:hypothetical protein